MAMFATLAKYYSDDALAKMLTTAKETESTKAIATKMEGLQITNWLNAGDSADDVFKTLKLEQTGGKLFENAVFPNWVAFVAKRNTQDPELAMFSTFARHYSDDALAKMLVAAKEVDSTRSIATKMENLQITNWINADKSSNEVFAILKLDQAGDKLFDSPVLSTWTSFVTKVNKNNPDDVMVTQLAEKFDDVSLAKMILAAAKVERTQSLAADLRSAQFKTWFTAGRTPKYVDTMLKVGANSDDVTKKISRDYEKFYGKVKVTVSESTNKKVDPQGASTSTRIRTR
ncbi:RxLR effector protein [Phytophthora megakarya]|uniref:RxLR effector protein n=1 Tax=Phytophthora megakarya TaxID=4795 RepID=A0A225WBB3_9STRA|nr:RxLR effector protein [Phytophthora megakarya]